jgi:hypothetical protein
MKKTTQKKHETKSGADSVTRKAIGWLAAVIAREMKKHRTTKAEVTRTANRLLDRAEELARTAREGEK